MKLCKDCHWSRNKHLPVSQWNCVSPKNIFPDTVCYVDGKPKIIIDYCNILRDDNISSLIAICGSQGLWHQTTQEVYPLQLSAAQSRLEASESKKLSKLTLEDLE